ncbi:hypothetical protein V8E53_013569 [Lactarius tabidus]
MRDPHRPPRRMETGWAQRFRKCEEEGSPICVWVDYVALVVFPLWWIAAVWRGSSAGRTRRRRCLWMTHRSSSVRPRVVYSCWRSLNEDRCALVAFPLSRHGGYLVGHLRPVYRPRDGRDLRMKRHRPSATAIPPPHFSGSGTVYERPPFLVPRPMIRMNEPNNRCNRDEFKSDGP